MKTKRILALLLAIVLILGTMSNATLAQDNITVYVSVAQNSKFVNGKSGEAIAYAPVVVNSQSPTIDDVFSALHENYYNDGASGYVTTDMGSYTSITKFWGVNSSAIGYYNNNLSAWSTADCVEDGAHLVFWFYQDNILMREMKKNKIHLEFMNTPIYNSTYIEAIANLYEFDCGELSGWMYKVNGWFPNYGSSRYQLKPGDKVEWVYTCDLGINVGGYYTGRQKDE